LKGLKSLQKHIKAGELCVVQTDKSKRFAILSKDQYLQSGLHHTKGHLEIEAKRVKRIQNFVNDHVFWLSIMTNMGSNQMIFIFYMHALRLFSSANTVK